MKEPTTVKEAIDLTLRKILDCMELPIGERGSFWTKNKWDYPDTASYCAFCVIAESCCNSWDRYLGHDCECVARKECKWFSKNIENSWLKKDLRKLYKMVEAIEC